MQRTQTAIHNLQTALQEDEAELRNEIEAKARREGETNEAQRFEGALKDLSEFLLVQENDQVYRSWGTRDIDEKLSQNHQAARLIHRILSALTRDPKAKIAVEIPRIGFGVITLGDLRHAARVYRAVKHLLDMKPALDLLELAELQTPETTPAESGKKKGR